MQTFTHLVVLVLGISSGWAAEQEWKVTAGIHVSLDVLGFNLNSKRIKVIEANSSCEEYGTSWTESVLVNCTTSCTQAAVNATVALHSLAHDTVGCFHDSFECKNDATSGFPQADERQLLFWQDLPKEARGADFVGVIAQFFNFEVTDDRGGMREDTLDFIVPARNGILAFQSGFNTRVAGELEERLWQKLLLKVEEAGAKMVFISNAFSFDKATGKSGTSAPDAEFLQKLLRLDDKLWSHLRDAGLKESGRFSVDQMAKWLCNMPMPGVDYSAHDLSSRIADIKARYRLAEGSPQEVSQSLLARFLSERQATPEATNPVLAACRDLHAAASAACGSAVADYLSRSAANLEKFGKTLEITDGQHFATLFQTEVPLLEPCKLVCKNGPTQPDFQDPGAFDTAMPLTWAVRGANVPQSLGWLEKAVLPLP